MPKSIVDHLAAQQTMHRHGYCACTNQDLDHGCALAVRVIQLEFQAATDRVARLIGLGRDEIDAFVEAVTR